MYNHQEYLLNIFKKQDKNGNIVIRESSEIEFKENFNFLNIAEYAKYMASFANRKGGYIIFGIKDKPRTIVGINISKFNEIPQEKITSFLNEYFSPEIEWEMAHIEYNSKAVGFIYTRESENKPVISKKNKDNVIRSGEIYYRYRAQTKCIEYGELRQIIDEIKEKEQYNWIRIFKDIAKIGPENVEINKKSNIEIKPSNNPKAIPVIVTEENLRKLYPWNHKQLISELKNRYENFKINQDFHKMKKKLLQNKEYGFTKKLDPNNPKTPKQDLYSPAILKEFDKIYKRR